MRLIDADAMHKFVEDKVAEGKDGWAKGVGYEWAWTLTAVDAQPTIDAVPVVHGRWERNIVIKCGLKHHEGFNASCCGRWSKYRTLYCPNCGAKMDGENNG